ncbi:hypothetical protein ACHAPT_004137 [Fusarium lateritium]
MNTLCSGNAKTFTHQHHNHYTIRIAMEIPLQRILNAISRPRIKSGNNLPVFIDREIAEMFVDKLISEIKIENKHLTERDMNDSKPRHPEFTESDAKADANLILLINADKNPWPEDPSYRVMRVAVQMPPTTPVPEHIEGIHVSRGNTNWAKVLGWGRFRLTEEYPGGEFFDLRVLPVESRMEWVRPVAIGLAKKSITLADPLQLGEEMRA